MKHRPRGSRRRLSPDATGAFIGALTPLRLAVFRGLWIAQFASNIGTWMQTVGAQWLLVDTSPLVVSLVQTAASLPMVLVAIPAGVWADLVDRRKLLLGAQAAMCGAAAALSVVTFTGHASPATVLLLTFALGCGNAVAAPAWQAIQPDLVDRAMLPQAAALIGVNINLARAIGPAIGGFVVAGLGPGWVFALNGVSFIWIATVVAMWRPHEREKAERRERFADAARTGGEYVRQSRVVRRLLYRAVLFLPAAGAVWALLPLAADDDLGLDSAGYGLLLAMVGVGAVCAALVLPRASSRLGTSRIVTIASVAMALAVLVVAFVPSPVVVGLALVPAGASWIAVSSTLNAGLQMALPNWVRARGLAYYVVVFQATQAVGAAVWGAVATIWSPDGSLTIAAALLLVGAVVGLRSPTPETADLDSSVLAGQTEAGTPLVPRADDGPVLVTLVHRVPPHHIEEFEAAMQVVGDAKRRRGALRWQLSYEPGDRQRFVESYLVGTWAEHVFQHRTGLSGGDRRLEAEALQYTSGSPELYHRVLPSSGSGWDR